VAGSFRVGVKESLTDVFCSWNNEKTVGEIVCIPDPATNSPIVPSVISFPSTLSSSLPSPVVGSMAKARIDTHPHTTLYHAKRVIGRKFHEKAVRELQQEVEFPVLEDPEDGTPYFAYFDQKIAPQRVGAYVLQHLLRITKLYLGHSSVTSAVIAVPAEFSSDQRAATLQAFRLAGIAVQRVLEEPTAAALAYGLHKKPGVEHVLVYDFGGGTLDVTVLRISPKSGYIDVMGSAGDGHLGGADFDDALVRYWRSRTEHDPIDTIHRLLDLSSIHEEEAIDTCRQKIPLCTLSSFHSIAEKVKIRLSSRLNHTLAQELCLTVSPNLPPIRNIAQDLCPNLIPYTLTLTPLQFHRAVSHLYDKSLRPIRQVLRDLDLSKHDIDEVVMVGGTTRMYMIRQLVKEELGFNGNGRKLNTDIDPDLTVAYGAASVID